MKKLLSIFLSTSLLFFTTNYYVYARTAWNNNYRTSFSSEHNQKPISIIKQNNGEKVILQSDETPTIIINNKSESHSNARAFSGGSSWTKIIIFLIKLAMLTLGAKFAFNKLKILGGNLTSMFSNEFISLKDFVKSLSVFNKNITNLEKKSINDSSQISYWGSILNFFRDSSSNNKDYVMSTPTPIPTPVLSKKPDMFYNTLGFLGNGPTCDSFYSCL